MEAEGQWWKSQLASDIHQALRIKVSSQRHTNLTCIYLFFFTLPFVPWLKLILPGNQFIRTSPKKVILLYGLGKTLSIWHYCIRMGLK